MFWDLLKLYKNKNFPKYNGDDFYDKLSRRYSTYTMLVFGSLISTVKLVGSPIKCWYDFKLLA